MKKSSKKKPAPKNVLRVRKRKRPQPSVKAAPKTRRAKEPANLQLLGSQQKRFSIWAANSSNEQLSERLRRFLPSTEHFWEAALKAGMSRQEYEGQLLNQSKNRSRIGGINRGARLVFSAAGWKKPAIGAAEGSATARGSQWRTAMAWTGLELLCYSLFPRINKCEADTMQEWCHLLTLATLSEEIKIPGGLKRSLKIRDMWQEEVKIF